MWILIIKFNLWGYHPLIILVVNLFKHGQHIKELKNNWTTLSMSWIHKNQIGNLYSFPNISRKHERNFLFFARVINFYALSKELNEKLCSKTFLPIILIAYYDINCPRMSRLWLSLYTNNLEMKEAKS